MPTKTTSTALDLPQAEPTAGGSYVRQPDGSLERVAATAPVRDKLAIEPVEPGPAAAVIQPEA